MEITDTQVLAQLKLRRVRLKLELERVEIAIRAFEDIDEKNIDFLEAAPYLVEGITPEDDDELAVATLMYNPNSSYQKKIKYALSKMREGTATYITQYILRVDRKIKDEKKLLARITYVASRMYKLGEIEARQDGRVNVYCLKSKIIS